MVDVVERSLYGGCIYVIIVWWLHVSDPCMVIVYESSLYGGSIREIILWWLYESSLYGG